MANKKCACGGYMNDWHSHASDCIVINSKGGRDYRVAVADSKNAEIARDIRELCEEVKKVVYDNDYSALDPDGACNLLEYVRIIKSMTWYIKE